MTPRLPRLLRTDYARTKKALDSCQFCPANEDGPPRAAVIAMGTKVYLACTQTEELVEGHCLIVPLQHTLTTLEGDDDVWDEIRVRSCSLLPPCCRPADCR